MVKNMFGKVGAIELAKASRKFTEDWLPLR